jgi:multisubunit Na+/H+ antiporter MnhG subunit
MRGCLVALIALLAFVFIINPIASYVTGELANVQAGLNR